MTKIIGILILALFSWVSAEPYYLSAPYFSSGYTAALTAAPVAATIPAPPLPALPAVPAVPAVPTVPAVLPASWNPVTSLSAYAYGSGYSVQEIPTVVKPVSANLVYGSPYASTLPWAYASDYFDRR